MDNSSHMIIVSILEARNIFKENYKCKDYVLVEARFNNESLLSDRVPLVSANPELLTELCWELDRKSLSILRKERKPIKLQCFLENEDQSEKELVGHIVLDLREAQESDEPQFSWRPLLHSKCKGPSRSRPELLLCLQFVKEEEYDKHTVPNGDNDMENADNYVSSDFYTNGLVSKNKMSHRGLVESNRLNNDDLEMDINVCFKDGSIHIWDSKSISCDSEKQNRTLSIVILRSSNLHKLLKLPAKLKEVILFHFKVNVFGISLRGNDFTDLRTDQARNENIHFYLTIDRLSTLKSYLQIHSLEIQLCDNRNKVLGFTTINIAKVVSNELQKSKRSTSFQLLPNDGSIVYNEPYPMVELSVELKDCDIIRHPDGQSRIGAKSDLLQPLATIPHHYCFTVDVRSITMNSSKHLPLGQCFVRYSYPLLGGKKFQTSSVKITSNACFIFEEGLGIYNFLVSPTKLDTTLQQVPFTLEFVDSSDGNRIVGVATTKLGNVFQSVESNCREVKSLHLPVINSKAGQIGEIHLLFNLKNFGLKECEKDLDSSLMNELAINRESISSDQIDELLIDAAYEIEVWKKNQLEIFEDNIKRRENVFIQKMEQLLKEKEDEHRETLIKRMERINELEEKLQESLKEIEAKNIALEEKRKDLDEREERIYQRLQNLNEEIAKKMSSGNRANKLLNNEENYTQRLESERNKLEKQIAHLEAKLTEKQNLVRDWESKYRSLLVSPRDMHGKVIDAVSKSKSEKRRVPATRVNRQLASESNKQKVYGTLSKGQIKQVTENKKAEQLLIQIQKGKGDLINKGLPPNHPIIKEIDSHLKS